MLGSSPIMGRHRLPAIEFLAETGTLALGDGIGRGKYLQLLSDKRKGIEFVEFFLLVNLHQQGIVPFALSHDFNPRPVHRIEVSRSDRQIRDIYMKSLTLAALYRTGRKKLLRTAHREGSMLQVLITKIQTIHHTSAAREGNHIRLCDTGQAHFLVRMSLSHQLLKIRNPIFVSHQRKSHYQECIKHQIPFHLLSGFLIVLFVVYVVSIVVQSLFYGHCVAVEESRHDS